MNFDIPDIVVAWTKIFQFFSQLPDQFFDSQPLKWQEQRDDVVNEFVFIQENVNNLFSGEEWDELLSSLLFKVSDLIKTTDSKYKEQLSSVQQRIQLLISNIAIEEDAESPEQIIPQPTPKLKPEVAPMFSPPIKQQVNIVQSDSQQVNRGLLSNATTEPVTNVKQSPKIKTIQERIANLQGVLKQKEQSPERLSLSSLVQSPPQVVRPEVQHDYQKGIDNQSFAKKENIKIRFQQPLNGKILLRMSKNEELVEQEPKEKAPNPLTKSKVDEIYQLKKENLELKQQVEALKAKLKDYERK